MEEKEEEEKVKRRKRKEEELAEERSREVYRSLTKKGPWAEHLTSLPKRGVGDLSTVSTFNHKRAPTSCLQRLKANNCTQNNVQQNHERLSKSSHDSTQHLERHDVTVSIV